MSDKRRRELLRLSLRVLIEVTYFFGVHDGHVTQNLSSPVPCFLKFHLRLERKTGKVGRRNDHAARSFNVNLGLVNTNTVISYKQKLYERTKDGAKQEANKNKKATQHNKKWKPTKQKTSEDAWSSEAATRNATHPSSYGRRSSPVETRERG